MKNALIVALLIVSVGCQKDVSISQNACTATDPLQVQWVKDIASSLKKYGCFTTLYQGTYKGGTVYFTLISDPSCDYVFGVELLDCYGKTVKKYGSSSADGQAFGNGVKIVKKLADSLL